MASTLSAALLLLVLACGKLLDNLATDGEYIVWSAACDQALVGNHLLVCPFPPALRMSACSSGKEVSVLPRTTSAPLKFMGLGRSC